MDAEIRDLVHKNLTGTSLMPKRLLTYEEKLCLMDLVVNRVGSWLVGWLCRKSWEEEGRRRLRKTNY